MSGTTKTSAASIVTADYLSATSKYTLVTYWLNPQTEIPLETTFNLNTDVTVPAFSSLDAPDEKKLVLEWATEDQFLGYDRFSGEIGGGRIFLQTSKGIIVKGAIVGGPTRGQGFVGAGTWTRA